MATFNRHSASAGLLCVGLLGAALASGGCRGDGGVRGDATQPGLTTVHDLDFKDYQVAAEGLIQSLLISGALEREDGKQPILMLSEIRNETFQHLDTQLLTQKVRIALNKSGKALTTTAVGLSGPEDPATSAVQKELRTDDMIDPETLPEEKKVVAPNFSLGGTITQKKTSIGRDSESYFSIHLVLTDVRTGLAVWEDEAEIVKQRERGLFGF